MPPPARTLLERAIERRMGGYRRQVARVDEAAPRELPRGGARRAVAVVGSGVAGITAAEALGARGFDVTLLDRNAYLGGKIGAWTTTLPGGETAAVEHGFHAFFRHYYNLRALLERAGAAARLAPIEDYVILRADGSALGFRGAATAPVLNLLSLAQRGVYRYRDLLANPSMRRLDAFLRYDRDATFARYDGVSFADFERQAPLPRDLRLAFRSFARAFFAEPEELSLAELIKSFHFYYLGHDRGLLYDYVDGDYTTALLAPLASHLASLGVRTELGRGVRALRRARGGAGAITVETDDGRARAFDAVVLAADVAGARALFAASPELAREAPGFAAQMARQRPGRPYAVLRRWSDAGLGRELPVFVSTDRRRALDSVTQVHRTDPAAARWAARTGPRASVLELHSYAVPDGLSGADAVRRALVDDLEAIFPAAAGARVTHEDLQLREDFAAFHVGMHAERPGPLTPVQGLYLAGDWVRLEHPAMLMEAACMAGLECANAILAGAGLRAEPVYAVPARGLLA